MLRMKQVELPGSGRASSQLGFGCAYLLPENAHLLDVAYEAGIRHFDVGRSYSRGLAEQVLGRFLVRRPEATVTAKFGLLPGVNSAVYGAARMLLRPTVRWLRKHAGRRGGPAAPPPGMALRKAVFTAEAAAASLATSLKALRRERLDVFLMHEASADDLGDPGLLEWLHQRQAAGAIGAFGVGGERSRIAELSNRRREYCRVLQYDWTPLDPPDQHPQSFSIVYRAFREPAARISGALAGDPAMLRRWCETLGADLERPGAVEQLLLRAALARRPTGVVLFSSQSPDHIRANAAVAANPELGPVAEGLMGLVRKELAARPAMDAGPGGEC